MKTSSARPAHRPAQFDAGADGYNRFRERTEIYLRETPVNELSVESWAWALNITRTTLSNYRKRGAVWKGIIEATRMRMRELRSGSGAGAEDLK